VLFNSAQFLIFFATFTVIYYLNRHAIRWLLLLAGSLYFYASANPVHLLLLLGLTLISYVTALGIAACDDRRTRRGIFAAGMLAAGAALFLFKYYDFVRTSVNVAVMPRLQLSAVLGLSFYTLSCLGYIADVYNGRLDPERHLGYFAVYVAFFPKLLAGPLERAKPFLAQLRRPVFFDDGRVVAGLQLMLCGLFKKVVIADRLAVFVDRVYRLPAFSASADLVVATYFFAFQLYCDFSAYSDMAIGAAQVLGFDLVDNFRRPYLSQSVREFWAHRWHLSLSAWFRDFVYIPLGGRSDLMLRTSMNLMIVFLLSGLWHGANWTFLVWGGLNGLYVVLESASRLKPSPAYERTAPGAVSVIARRVLTFHLILVTWVFFRAATLGDALTIVERVGHSIRTLPAALFTRIGTVEVAWSIALIAGLLAFEVMEEARPLRERMITRPLYVRWGVYYALVFGIVIFGRWDLRQFVYMQF
jgi:D-alanyl-lipoteichoic acid acyltransferase DltB (MBOAT superfamily)